MPDRITELNPSAPPVYLPQGAAVPPGYQTIAVPINYPQGPTIAPTQPVSIQPTTAVNATEPVPELRRELVLVSHSMLFYWWPVWVLGFAMAIITWTQGSHVEIGGGLVRVHASNNLGILFFLTVFLVILITNIEVRGLASGLVIMSGVLVALFLAYMRWWDEVLGFFGHLNVYLNQGAYFWFSALLFLVWAFSTFVVDRMSYWLVKPGQITREYVWGASSESYDTQNITMEKRRDDLFRHWLLGLGSGDLRIHTFGGAPKEIFIPNVLFMSSRIRALEDMIATESTELSAAPPRQG